MTTPCTKEREIGEIAATVRSIDRNVGEVKLAVEKLVPDVIAAKIQQQQNDKLGRGVFAIVLIFISAAISFVVAAANK